MNNFEPELFLSVLNFEKFKPPCSFLNCDNNCYNECSPFLCHNVLHIRKNKSFRTSISRNLLKSKAFRVLKLENFI